MKRRWVFRVLKFVLFAALFVGVFSFVVMSCVELADAVSFQLADSSATGKRWAFWSSARSSSVGFEVGPGHLGTGGAA